MGKKQKKPGKGKQKTERKTEKAIEKRIKREEKFLDEEDDIDAILAKIKEEDAKKVAIQVDDGVPHPSARCNCSATLNPAKDTEIIVYGGEFYNGDKTFVYGDLFRYNLEKDEWKHVSSPNSPPPRSAHQAVAWKNYLFIFGGEFTSPNQERFHHYRDLWRLDLTTNAWEQLQLPGGPSARSGHRMVLWKHKILLFGGFYDTLREVKYYNDMYMLDLDEYKWTEVRQSPGAAWPTPRSACQLAVCGDELFLYGGYFKAAVTQPKKGDKEDAEKGEVLGDMWMLDLTMWEWNKVRKLGSPPEPRAGFSLAVHKKRAILFGGVVDSEKKDTIQSKFLNDMYAFQMDNRRWFTLQLRKPKASKVRVKSKEVEAAGESDMAGEIVEDEPQQVEVPGNGEEPSPSLADNIEEEMATKLQLSSKELSAEETSTPCGRINSSLVVSGNMLYVFGGIMEVGEQEVTLDDLHSLDLAKLDKWNCIIEASHSEWVEVEDEDEIEEEEEGENALKEEKNEEDDEDGSEGGSEGIGDEGALPRSEVEMAASLLRGEGKPMTRKQRKEEMDRIRADLGLSDPLITPQLGESLKDFFARTSLHWQQMAYGRTHNVGKELRKDGFDLCEFRFQELRPLLDELERLEREQKAEEEEERRREKENKEKNKRHPHRA